MSLNGVEIQGVLDELDPAEMFIQNIRQPDYNTLLFDLYGRERSFTLLVSFRQNMLRLHSTYQKFTALPKPPRFLQFLKAHVKGAKITEVVQIYLERVIRIKLERGGEVCLLYIRLWGGAANIIVTTTQGLILDAFSRRPQRGEIPGAHFQPETRLKPDGKSRSIRDIGTELSLNRYFDLFYHQKEEDENLFLLEEQIQRAVDKKERQILSSLDSITGRKKSLAETSDYRKWADLIMANLHLLKKIEGQSSISLDDYENPGTQITIPLDPRLDCSANAQRYYKRKTRDEKALAQLEEEETNRRRQQQILLTESRKVLESRDLVLLRSYLDELTRVPAAERQEESVPGLRFESGGFTILVGRSADDNDTLLRRHVRGNDMWLHTRDWPGGYVFIRTKPGKSIPLDVLLDAGNLAVLYSKARSQRSADLFYTQVKHLRRAKGAPKGTVLPSQEKNLSVRLDDFRLRRLFGRDDWDTAAG